MLLPIETKFDITNNIVYTEVDEFGTYCLVDMVHWLENFDVDVDSLISMATSVNSNSNISPVGFSAFSAFSTTQSASDITQSNLPQLEYSSIISENQEENDGLFSVVPQYPVDELPASQAFSPFSTPFMANSIVLPELKPSNSKVDIVFILQKTGHFQNAFNAQKQMILNVSSEIFEKTPDARIYIIEHGLTSNILQNVTSSKNHFTSFNDLQIGLNGVNYSVINQVTNLGLAFHLLNPVNPERIIFRNDAENFVFHLANGSMTNGMWGQLGIASDLQVSYSEIMLGVGYQHSVDHWAILNAIVSTGGISYGGNPNAQNLDLTLTRLLIEYFNLRLSTPPLLEMHQGTNWERIQNFFSEPLKKGGSNDTNKDGITDWNHVDIDFLESYWVARNAQDSSFVIPTDGTVITSDMLPSIWYMSTMNLNYMPFRYANTNNSALYGILDTITVLPLKSNPFIMVGQRKIQKGDDTTDAERDDRGSFVDYTPNNIGNTFGADPKSTRIITWQTSKGVTEGEVIIGFAYYPSIPNLEINKNPNNDDRHYHRVEIRGLKPGSTHSYVCGTYGSYSESFQFTTAPATIGNDGFTVLHVTDSQIGQANWGTEERDAIIWGRVMQAGINRVSNPAFVVHTGDVTESSSRHERRLVRLSYYHDYIQTIKAQQSFVYSLGNNDGDSNGTGGCGKDWYNKHFASPGKILNNNSTESENYSFVYGNARFINIHYNSNVTITEAMKNKWRALLQDEVGVPKPRWKVVMIHESPYGKNNPTGGNLKELADLFKEHDIDLILAGDNHAYVRSFPITRNDGGHFVSIVSNYAGSGSSNGSTLQHLAVSQRVASPMFSAITFEQDQIKLKAYTVNTATNSPSSAIYNNEDMVILCKKTTGCSCYFHTCPKF
jgi:predicted phosphodiesterase